MNVFPSSYLPSILYIKSILESKNPIIDVYEHYKKQSCRNRAFILTSQGKYPLIVPVIKKAHFTPVNELQISYKEDWVKIHWRTIATAYAKSAYFEYYSNELKEILFTRENSLITLNHNILQYLFQSLQIQKEVRFSSKYIEKDIALTDYRSIDFLKVYDGYVFPHYFQVFDHKIEFNPNLSVLDLLFNLGPEAILYINGINKPSFLS